MKYNVNMGSNSNTGTSRKLVLYVGMVSNLGNGNTGIWVNHSYQLDVKFGDTISSHR